MADRFWDELRARAEIQVHRAGEGGVRLHGGPMDVWLVKKDADALDPDWYMTWPPTVASAHRPGLYRVSDNGKWATWEELSER